MRSPSHHHAETLPNTEVRLQGDEEPVVDGGGGVLGDGLVLLDKQEPQHGSPVLSCTPSPR